MKPINTFLILGGGTFHLTLLCLNSEQAALLLSIALSRRRILLSNVGGAFVPLKNITICVRVFQHMQVNLEVCILVNICDSWPQFHIMKKRFRES